MTFDTSNAIFEVVGAFFVWSNVKALLRDKTVKGVNLSVVGFYLAWNVHNIFYYSSLGHWASLVADLGIMAAQATWLVLALYYRREHKRRFQDAYQRIAARDRELLARFGGLMRTPADLRFVLHAIDFLFFGQQCANDGVTIRWKRFRQGVNHFCFGEFDSDKKQIRINIRLAQPDVPDYVVSAVVWHEALHHIIGLEHNVAFQKAEHRFPHFYEAESWCDEFILRDGHLKS